MTTHEAAMLSPSAAFQHPAEVVRQAGWSAEQKLRVLRQWKYDLGQLQVATEENMPPAIPVMDVSIRDIHAAMTALGYAPDTDPAPTKGA
ncbi:MAG: hypothetical protein ABI567_11630 [Gammaproteobacteria bacterium]